MAVPLTLKVFKDNQLITQKDYDRDIIKIGRLASAHLCIDDKKASRIHSIIEITPDGRMSIVDMGSPEGTLLNDKRVNKGALQFGDEIRIGETVIKVEKAGVAQSFTGPALPQPAAVAAPPVASPTPSPVQQAPGKAIASRVRARPRRGMGSRGIELRFFWGDEMVGESFLHLGADQSFKIGNSKDVDFAMDDELLGSPAFEMVRLKKTGDTAIRFTSKMTGEFRRQFGDEHMTLTDAQKCGVASVDGDGYAIRLVEGDFALINLGHLTAEVYYQRAPRRVTVPLRESINFTVLNIFLVCFFLAALFVISAKNLRAEGETFDGWFVSDRARFVKLLAKRAEKNLILEKLKQKEKEKEVKEEVADKAKEKQPKRTTPKPSKQAQKPPKSRKEKAKQIASKIFGGSGGGGISNIFGSQGLGGAFKDALGGVSGAGPTSARGLANLGLRGSGSGGGGVGGTIGIGGIGTKGRGGGSRKYGSGVGGLGGKKGVKVNVSASEPTIIGSLPKDLIRKVIRVNRGQIRFCYESQLNRFPKLSGKVIIKFVISASGSVVSSKVVKSTANNPTLEKCVVGRVRTWVFPKPKGKGVVIVTYPFIFKLSGG